MNENLLLGLEEEKRYMFTSFSAKTAFRIGEIIVKLALEKDAAICTDIFAYGKILFHFSSDKCTPDNDNWVRKKRNTVLYFGHSSKFIGDKLNNDISLIKTKYGKNIDDFAVIPGGFPIIIAENGVVGAICVSGMKPEEDHQLILDTIRKVLNRD